jgi:hypothetical protein
MNTAQPHRIRKLAEGHRAIQAIIERMAAVPHRNAFPAFQLRQD